MTSTDVKPPLSQACSSVKTAAQQQRGVLLELGTVLGGVGDAGAGIQGQEVRQQGPESGGEANTSQAWLRENSLLVAGSTKGLGSAFSNGESFL